MKEGEASDEQGMEKIECKEDRRSNESGSARE
jgi:hypothetical protein